jgi:hypothetical protein
MDVEITPQPSEKERQAILRALEIERTDPPARSRWWLAGLAPEEGEDQPATAPRRHSRGAARA